MKESEEHLQSLLQKVEERERTARRRAIIYSLVPILLLGMLLWFTGHRIIQAQHKLDTINQQIEDATEEYRQKLADKEEELKIAQERLNDKKQELTETRNMLREEQRRLSEKERELSQKKEELKKVQEEAMRSLKELNELKFQINQEKKKLADAKKELTNKEQELNQKRKELVAINQRLEQTERNLAAKKQELEKLQKNIGELLEEIGEHWVSKTKAWMNIVPENRVSQSFITKDSVIKAVSVALTAANPRKGSDTITLKILSADEQVLATASKMVSEGFDGWLRFTLPRGGLKVTPERKLVIRVEDTGKVVFGWKYVGTDIYQDGSAIFSGKPCPNRDFLFRINR
jgi:DNA repair exonuclease SbcCD ATPase subunit